MSTFIYLLAGLLAYVAAQSNYDNQANSIEYAGDGLPESTILDGKVTKLDDIAPIIFLNRTKAALNCAAGFMQIDLKFENAFYGIVYAEFDRSSVCTIVGNGTRTARIELPLKGCGTTQNPTRVFTNNIVVRFHPGLEMDGDEVITIVCRYPPPVAPPPALPALVPGPLLPTVEQAPLRGFQLLLIICGILFLSLVLLGLAASYYCLRNQRIQVIRKHPLVGGAGSELTKMSDTSTGNLSMYEGLKIPRAHAVATTTTSASICESEVAMVSGAETIPSDYPSESPSSEVEEILDGQRSLSSSGSYENKAYVQESSYYSEQQQQEHYLNEMQIAHHRPPPPEPKFNVEMRVKKAPLPPPTPSASSSDTEGSVIMQETSNLSTIHERDETYEMNTFQYRPAIHSPPRHSKSPPPPPPIYSQVRRKNILEQTDYTEESMDQNDYHRSEYTTDMAPVAKPEITSHLVDDVFLRTITEKKTIEDIERHRRQTTEYHAKQPPPPTKWDVEIRNYPNPNAPPPGADESTSSDWDTHSENSSIYGVPASSTRPRMPNLQQTHTNIDQRHHQYTSNMHVPLPDHPPANWENLVRVLDYPHSGSESESRETYRSSEYTTLTLDDRKKWRKIITTESTLRTLLTEASTREDYERIRKDQRYEKLFEPEKWDVLIRVLSQPPSQERLFDQKAGGAGSSNRYRRKSEWDTRSRRNSLPTLYEYDSDGNSIRNVRERADTPGAFDPTTGRSRRTSGTSMRSMSEIMVDFARQDMPDNMSDTSSYYKPLRYYEDEDDDDNSSLVRSLSQPSLARSASEFTESWGMRGHGWDAADSPQHTPQLSRRSTWQEAATSSTFNTRQQSSMYQEKQWYEHSDRL